MTFSSSQQIVLASGNLGKIKEIQAILATHRIVPQSVFNIQEAEETGLTFVENAIIKARNAALHAQLPAIADDSGLVVDALKGEPGVFSARYAGLGASDQDNVTKLLQALEGVPDEQRTARFICVMVFMAHAEDPFPVIAQGVWEGRILHHAVGTHGFGYDPVFIPDGSDKTFAEMTMEEKNKFSHRKKAVAKLISFLKDKKWEELN